MLATLAGALLAPTVQAAPPTASLVVSGQGGQALVLAVPAGGLDIGYPTFMDARLPGPDGTVGGVVIQRASDGEVAGGVLLLNAPGFTGALGITLNFKQSLLPQGRYVVTLLGRGRTEVHLTMRNRATGRRLQARGPASPITRTVGGSAPVIDSWSTGLGRTGGEDYLVIGSGSGGDAQQAENATMCLTASAGSGPCLTGDGDSFLSPGAGGAAVWAAMPYPPGTLERGTYTFSGRTIGIGAGSTSAHLAVVIALRH